MIAQAEAEELSLALPYGWSVVAPNQADVIFRDQSSQALFLYDTHGYGLNHDRLYSEGHTGCRETGGLCCPG